MSLSDKLASLNFDRYQSWKAEKKISDNSKPALLVFKGDVYQGLQLKTLKKVILILHKSIWEYYLVYMAHLNLLT